MPDEFLERRFELRLGNAAGVVRDSRRGDHRNDFEYLLGAEPPFEEASLVRFGEVAALFDQRTRQR
jgi:hypothetical protein